MKNSIINIESLNNNAFGTGFVIHGDEERGVCSNLSKGSIEALRRQVKN
jgi:hypothetical protein